jgi:hypothetical protein
MKHTNVYLCGLITSALMMSGAQAHHSNAMFDMKNSITVEGVIKEFQFTNPHTWLLVNVTGKDGKVVVWGFENEAPTQLMREGVRRSDFPPGARVRITADPLKSGEPGGHWTDIELLDSGKKISRSRGPGLPPPRGAETSADKAK